MDEVKFSALGKPPEYRVILLKGHMVPSHVGNFERFATLPQILREPFHRPRYNTEALCVILFTI